MADISPMPDRERRLREWFNLLNDEPGKAEWDELMSILRETEPSRGGPEWIFASIATAPDDTRMGPNASHAAAPSVSCRATALSGR